jgi:hypothetical protein
VEVGAGLLGGGVEVQEHHLLGWRIGEHGAAQEIEIPLPGEPREQRRPALRHLRDLRQHLSPDVALHELHAVEGGEALQLDETGDEAPLRVPGDGEVDGVEVGRASRRGVR